MSQMATNLCRAWTHSLRLGETTLCLLREDELPIHCYLKVPPVCHGPRDVYTRHLVLQKLGEAFVAWGVPSSATSGESEININT